MTNGQRTNMRISLVLLGYLCFSIPAALPLRAQVVSDGTTQTSVEISGDADFTILGGQLVNDILIHRFSDFSVPESGSATFRAIPDTQIIVGQVTGNSVSFIEGTIRVDGSSDLLLINPNGIIFGQDSSLDLSGSFLASTARGVKIGEEPLDTEESSSHLLKINLPIGLQFDENPGNIINRSSANSTEGELGGLRVPSQQTLALLGGSVIIENGLLSAPNGKIIISSFSGGASVNAFEAVNNQNLSSIDDTKLGSIDITGMSRIEVLATTPNEGMIQLVGKEIRISGQSQIFGLNLGSVPGVSIDMIASDLLELSNGSNIRSDTLSEGSAGNIAIYARDLVLTRGSTIGTTSQSDGVGGNIVLDVENRLEVTQESQITSQAFASGNAGDIEIDAREILIEERGQFTTTTFGSGEGGEVSIKADLMELKGDIKDQIQSGIFSRTATRSQTATGNGGEIMINAGRLILEDGAVITGASENDSQGSAGDISILANTVDIRGDGSSITGTSGNEKSSGNLTIEANDVVISNGGAISVESLRAGSAGTLEIKAESLSLTDQGLLNASTQGGEGDIIIQIEGPIFLRRASRITTDARGNATGGNITIGADTLTALEDSDITANAEQGGAGNISITAQGLFIDGEIFDQDNPSPVDEAGIPIGTPDSDIIASSQFGQQGQVEINNPDTDPTQGSLQPTTMLPDAAITQGCSSGGRSASFINIGSGGTRFDPADLLSNPDTWEDPSLPSSWLLDTTSSEAKVEGGSTIGWGFTPDVEITSLAESPSTLFKVWCPSYQEAQSPAIEE